MVDFNKDKVKEQLTIENIFDLVNEWGGDPEYTNFGFVSSTICHNHPGEGSRKLYFYGNSFLFRCYTGCDEVFDIFDLAIRVSKLYGNSEYNLNDAVRYVAAKCGIQGAEILGDFQEETAVEDWKNFQRYEKLETTLNKATNVITLKPYDDIILNRLNYSLELTPWLKEGISPEALKLAKIGYYLGGDQISIPHFDKDGRLVGLRGRALCKEEAEKFGKYRPLYINQQFYNHPLGANLYGLNWNKENINRFQKAIIFESEKSVLLYESYFGRDVNISVACCGSSISGQQIQLLIDAGAKEAIVAFDRQFQEIGDNEYNHLTNNLTKIHNKYKNDISISFIFDKNKITNYKDSPIDCGKEKFIELYTERISL